MALKEPTLSLIRSGITLGFVAIVSICASFSQTLNSKVDMENFNYEISNDALIQALNKVRAAKNLPTFSYHLALEKAAKDQAVYNRKYSIVSSEQKKKKKATPKNRTAYFDGLFKLVDEYDLGIEIQMKSTLKGGRRDKKPATYEEVIDHIIEEWQSDRKLDELLNSKLYHQIGFGFAANHIDGLLFVSVVLASEEYQKYEKFSYNKKSFKLSPYDRSVCKSFERNFEYSSELFSDNLRIINNKIYFYYHDLNLIESLFKTNRDAMAVDILFKNQYDCNKGNALHPSTVSDGMLLKPVKKSKLLKGNSLEEIKEFKVQLGTLPIGIDTNDIVLDLIIIQDKCACNNIRYNDLKGKNIRLLDIDLVVDTISISESIDSNSRFLEFTVPFEKNKSDYLVEDIKPFLDSIQLNRFNIKEISIKAYSSIEGNPIANEELQQKRAKSILTAIKEYQLQEVETNIESEENWDGFIESIKASPHAADFNKKDHNEIRSIVNSDTLKYDLEPFLAGQRKAEIRIFVESIYIDSLNTENLHGKFEKALEDKDFIRAKAIQTLIYRAVLEGELTKDVLFDSDILQYREYIPLLSNRNAFLLEFNEGEPSDSLINALNMNLEALLGIDPTNGHLNYNKQAIKLYYWAKDINGLIIDEENRIDEVKDFYRDIRKLYNTKIDNYHINRLLMNYNIIAADFYYEKQDFKKRVRALKQVLKYVKKAKLNREQTLTMARYFIYQMQIDWAVQIMMPYVKKKNFDSDFLMTFLSISVYDQKHVSDEMFHEYLEIASEKYQRDFCSLFQKPGMSVEFFSDIRTKSIYCASCK